MSDPKDSVIQILDMAEEAGLVNSPAPDMYELTPDGDVMLALMIQQAFEETKPDPHLNQEEYEKQLVEFAKVQLADAEHSVTLFVRLSVELAHTMNSSSRVLH